MSWPFRVLTGPERVVIEGLRRIRWHRGRRHYFLETMPEGYLVVVIHGLGMKEEVIVEYSEWVDSFRCASRG